MKRVQIRLCGCDDETELLMDVTDEQRAFLEELAKRSAEASEYGCQPRLKVADA